MSGLFVLGVVLLFAGVWLLRRADTLRRDTGLPAGRVVSVDESGWAAPSRPLFSERYRLTGRPDYVVQHRRETIPVEVKPGRRAGHPYDGDILQLGAYCLLVEETTGRAPSHGLLKYASGVFRVDYTLALRRIVLEEVAAIRRDRSAQYVGISHQDTRRCRACGVRDSCDERLA